MPKYYTVTITMAVFSFKLKLLNNIQHFDGRLKKVETKKNWLNDYKQNNRNYTVHIWGKKEHSQVAQEMATKSCILNDRIFQTGVLLLPALNEACLVSFFGGCIIRAGYQGSSSALKDWAAPEELLYLSQVVSLCCCNALCLHFVIFTTFWLLWRACFMVKQCVFITRC